MEVFFIYINYYMHIALGMGVIFQSEQHEKYFEYILMRQHFLKMAFLCLTRVSTL